MATITSADVISIAPELASVDSARMDSIIGMVAPRVSDCAFGTDAKLAACLLVAHTVTVLNRGGTGQVTSETVGDISRNYQASDPTDSLSETGYGRQYKELRDANVFGVSVV